MGRIVAIAEGELAERLDDPERIACRAGCSYCCVLTVAVLAPEVVAMVDFVQTHWPDARRQRLAERLTELEARLQGMDEEEWLALSEPCAFLDESGSCSIYPVRPLICRSITSTDPRDCREALDEPLTGVARPVLMNLMQKSLMDETFIALGDALEQLGFETRSSPLTVAARLALADATLAERFMTRSPVWA
jgi:Fe-S-cluster containining protein